MSTFYTPSTQSYTPSVYFVMCLTAVSPDLHAVNPIFRPILPVSLHYD
jgi:hypothetical protein